MRLQPILQILTATAALTLAAFPVGAQPASETSTAGIQFPEQTGQLPLADMPSGGVRNDKLPRTNTPEGGVKDDWRHGGIPPGSAASQPSACACPKHGHGGASSRPSHHKCSHCKKGGASSQPSHHGHGIKCGCPHCKKGGAASQPSGHGNKCSCPHHGKGHHAKGHHGKKCQHGKGHGKKCGCPHHGKGHVGHKHHHAKGGHGHGKGKGGFNVGWFGFLRVIGGVTENDPLPHVGRTDGFRLGSARFGTHVTHSSGLEGVISVEAGATQANGLNDPNAQLSVELRDAFLDYTLARTAALKIGRFKAPYDISALESSSERVFIDAPVESRGVGRTQGNEVPGLGPDRQLGVMLFRERLGLSEDGFDMGYALALTNGRTFRLALNDNDKPAGYVRLSGHLGKMFSLNLGGFVDTRTVGTLPNLFEEEVKGAEASLVFRIQGLRIEAQGLLEVTDFTTTGVQSATALGFHAQWSYRLSDLEVGYRFAYFDTNDTFEGDLVKEHTIAVSYIPSDSPLKFTLNGIVADEEVELDNNRIDLLAQFDF